MDEGLWRAFKGSVILKGLTIAEGVEEALIQYFKLQNTQLATSASIASTATSASIATPAKIATDSDSY